MSRETENEALNIIQDIADFIAVEYGIRGEAREYLRIIEALAKHRDKSSDVLDPSDQDRLARVKRANQQTEF